MENYSKTLKIALLVDVALAAVICIGARDHANAVQQGRDEKESEYLSKKQKEDWVDGP